MGWFDLSLTLKMPVSRSNKSIARRTGYSSPLYGYPDLLSLSSLPCAPTMTLHDFLRGCDAKYQSFVHTAAFDSSSQHTVPSSVPDEREIEMLQAVDSSTSKEGSAQVVSCNTFCRLLTHPTMVELRPVMLSARVHLSFRNPQL